MARIDKEGLEKALEDAKQFVQTEHDELMADSTKVRLVAFSTRESQILGQVVAQSLEDANHDMREAVAEGDTATLENILRVREVFASIAKKFIAAREDAHAGHNPNGFAGSAERQQ